MSRAACYCLTRGLYRQAIPSMRSLLHHTKIDRLYLLTEDDQLPYAPPEQAVILNVRDQTYFPAGGLNRDTRWTWMVLMRAALFDVLRYETRVLSLDADTIFHADAGALFDLDLSGYYLAGVREPYWSPGNSPVYINGGVVMQNLDALRDGTGDEIIRRLNKTKYNLNEQECMNECCRGRILELPGRYNRSSWTVADDVTVIRHYAAERDWFTRPEVQKWYEEAPRGHGR